MVLRFVNPADHMRPFSIVEAAYYVSMSSFHLISIGSLCGVVAYKISLQMIWEEFNAILPFDYHKGSYTRVYIINWLLSP